MPESNDVVVGLQGGLTVGITHKGDKDYVAACTHKELELKLGNAVVQQALVNSKYNIVPAGDAFSITHNNEYIGKLYGDDNNPKKDDEGKNA
uniref:Uncharacterized protein n=1 Tax=Panagrolaimus sp. PS1159 TaxID=55785 RepID=A0AC35F8M9_9BILA